MGCIEPHHMRHVAFLKNQVKHQADGQFATAFSLCQVSALLKLGELEEVLCTDRFDAALRGRLLHDADKGVAMRTALQIKPDIVP